MKKLIIASTCAVLCTQAYAVKYSINNNWKFQLDGVDSGWSVVDLPHTWNAEDAMDDIPGYHRGKGTYSKTFRLDKANEDKVIYLCFEGANQETTVKVNGHEVGNHIGGYTGFNFDITPYVNFDGDNELIVTVDNSHNPAIPPLSADFTFFGGIYRDVYLLTEELVHISHGDYASSGIYVTPLCSDAESGTVDIEMLLDNFSSENQEVEFIHTIYDFDGNNLMSWSGKEKLKPGEKQKSVKSKKNLQKLHLWSADNPKLYRLQTEVKDKKTGKVFDSQTETFGFRWFSFDPDKGFFLNGEPMKLVGVNRHQDYPGLGYAASDEHQIRDMHLIKDIGANFLRVSHYPQDPLVLHTCDQLGILTSVEIPIVNAVTETEEFLQNSLEMQKEMIKQNYNHPSVIIWAYMNEVMLVPPYSREDERYKPYCQEVNRQAKAIDALTRQMDPTRYTMLPFNNDMRAYDDADLYDVPMIVGWNMYPGWYGGLCSDLEKFLDKYHSEHPNKPTIMSEYGADCDTRLHSDNPLRFDYTIEYSDIYHEHYLNALKQLDYLAGGAIWNLVEFHSEGRRNAVPHMNLKGIVTADRKPKNIYYLYRANFSDEPFIKFASSEWTNRSGLLDENGVYNQEVKIYSNSEKADVVKDGKWLGKVIFKEGVATITVPFTQGFNQLTVIADNGASDLMDINFEGVDTKLNGDFKSMNILLGSNRSFTDPKTGVCWIPEKPYEKGSWGYVGGEVVYVKNWAGNLPASDIDVLGTDNDPLFQTRRKNLESFRADVPDGNYAVYLYWADLTKEKYKRLAYNLGNDVIHEESNDKFGVSINDTPLFESLDVRSEVGRQRPLVVRSDVEVKKGEGITVDFTPITGETTLHAIRIVKL